MKIVKVEPVLGGSRIQIETDEGSIQAVVRLEIDFPRFEGQPPKTFEDRIDLEHKVKEAILKDEYREALGIEVSAMGWLDLEWQLDERGLVIEQNHWPDRFAKFSVRLRNVLRLWAWSPDRRLRSAHGIRTWREVAGFPSSGHSLTARDILVTKGVGRVTIEELLTALNSVGVEPTWADEIRRYYRLEAA